jgi:glycosyltransferase involved in cell wall biosynthesis
MQELEHEFRPRDNWDAALKATDGCKIIAADIPLDCNRYPVRELLYAFRAALEIRQDLRLIFAGRREPHDAFLVWNFVDEHGLADHVLFLPYFDLCREFPVKKQDCALWITRETLAANLTPADLLAGLQAGSEYSSKLALFITSFCPAKLEGNSALMRQWLAHLRAAGYRIHLLYYNLESSRMTLPLRQATRRLADMVVEVEVESLTVGSNSNGLNVHVDDWCGAELLEAVRSQVSQFEYDLAIVNYSFLSATFMEIAEYTRKILITHDDFADRNRRMLAQGFPESGWVSLDRRGEALAFRRADVVVALQDGEADSFRALAAENYITSQICVVTHLPETAQIKHPTSPIPEGKIRIGYLGSSNWVNEQNLVAFLKEWVGKPALVAGSEIVLAGGLCDTLMNFMSDDLMKSVSPRLLGEVQMLYTFFEQCDVFINPERGGTGIKIKTLDAMAHDAAVLTTTSGAVGIGSASRFHNASNAAELVSLVEECVFNHGVIEQIRNDTRQVFAAFSSRHRASLDRLLGPPVDNLPDLMMTPGDPSPKVSVIIPFYNVEAYIEECIRSVLSQDFDDFEILVVDDQSPDGSRLIVERLAAQDPRIKLITHPTNAGLGPARNTGVRFARGTYILFLDSDDLLAGDHVLGQLIISAAMTGCQVVIGSCERLKPDGRLMDEDRERDRQANGKPGEKIQGLDAFMSSLGLPGRGYLPVRAWGTLILRDYYLETGLDFPSGEHEDMPHIPFLYYHANGVYYDPLIAIRYRERFASLSKTNWTSAKFERYVHIWALMKSGMIERGLHAYIGDAASTFAGHLMWRVDDHGVASDASDAASATLALILQDISGASCRKLLFAILGGVLRHPWDALHNRARHDQFIRQIPSDVLMEFHHERLGIVAR